MFFDRLAKTADDHLTGDPSQGFRSARNGPELRVSLKATKLLETAFEGHLLQ